ncbi:MAG: response regulator [bacterium]
MRADTEKKKVLIVDDDLDLQDALSLFLSGEGYETACEGDGKGAINSARGFSPSIIILDVMLPDTDGFRVCEQLKKDPDTSGIPVVFLSVKDQLKHKIRGYIVGGHRYIVKPFDKNELLKTIRTVLRQKEIGEHPGDAGVLDPRD